MLDREEKADQKFFPEIRLIARIVLIYSLALPWLCVPDKDWLKHKRCQVLIPVCKRRQWIVRRHVVQEVIFVLIFVLFVCLFLPSFEIKRTGV